MRLIYGLLIASVAIYGQWKPEPKQEFEVIAIKPSGEAPVGRFNLGVHIDGAQFRCTSFSLKDYVVMAYRLKTYQFSGPDWMASTRFDISAKLPDGATRDQVAPMVRSMLEDRFQLKVHHDSKDFSVYALTVAKSGLKMKESPLDENPPDNPKAADATNVDVSAGAGRTTMVNLGKGASLSFGDNRLNATKVTMAVLADQLGRFMDRPVVDMTDLKGTYDLSLEFQPDDFLVMRVRAAVAAGVQLPPQAMHLLENASDGPVLSAVQTLGLKMETRKAPLEILVVDSVLKVPTEN